MTAQAREILSIDDLVYSMNTKPLTPLLKSRQDIFFKVHDTGNYSGYVGHWSIENNSLYLTGINADIYWNAHQYSRCRLLHIVGKDEPALADWYSGVLELNDGQLLKYVHGGYLSIYERTIFIEIEKGKVITQWIRTNSLDEKEDFVKPNWFQRCIGFFKRRYYG